MSEAQATLAKMLRLKFGAEAADTVSAQIKEAPLETVQNWIERFANTETLNEIFSSPS